MLNSNLKKLVVVFTVLVVIFGFVSSYLYIQVYDLAKQAEDLQNQNSVLEGQVLEYQYQTNQLETQISELQQEKYALQENVSELEKFIEEKITKVNITEFYISGFYSHPPGIHTIGLNMTIHNQGVNHVKNLMINVNFTDNEKSSFNRTIDVIYSGEIRHLTFATHWLPGPDYPQRKIVATLYANDLLLDEVTLINPYYNP